MSEKLKHRYLFPNPLAKVMAKMDLRLQLESSMMSMTLILIGMVITITYLVIYFNFPLWYKIVLVINGLAGIVFLWSFLVTTFNQYRSYMEAQEFQKNLEEKQLDKLEEELNKAQEQLLAQTLEQEAMKQLELTQNVKGGAIN